MSNEKKLKARIKALTANVDRYRKLWRASKNNSNRTVDSSGDLTTVRQLRDELDETKKALQKSQQDSQFTMLEKFQIEVLKKEVLKLETQRGEDAKIIEQLRENAQKNKTANATN